MILIAGLLVTACQVDSAPQLLTEAQLPTEAPTSCADLGHPLFGSVVCAPGDADGDGVPDLIVADPCYARDHGTGRAWLVSGKTLRVIFERAIDWCTEDTQFSIHSIDDTNADGARDWLLSSTWIDPQADAHLVVVSGKDGSVLERRKVEGAGDAPTGGEARVDLGDLDGDGAPDYVIGQYSGAVIFSGKDGMVLRRIPRPVEEGESDFAATLAALGDVDGDKLCDLAIGSPGWGVAEGIVRVYSSATCRRLYTAELSQDGWHWGSRLAALGDIDGDGINDVAVATWNALSHEPGRACIVSGKDGKPLITFMREGNSLSIQRHPRMLSPDPKFPLAPN